MQQVAPFFLGKDYKTFFVFQELKKKKMFPNLQGYLVSKKVMIARAMKMCRARRGYTCKHKDIQIQNRLGGRFF